MPSGLPRRSLLTGGAMAGLLGALTGCTSGDGSETADQAEAAATTRGLTRRAARDSTDLLARYDATISAHPSLGATLAPFRESVAAHVTALRASDEATGGPTGGAPEVPAEPDPALEALMNAERGTADERLRTLADAPPELARLLASLAAAGSVHVYLLNEARA